MSFFTGVKIGIERLEFSYKDQDTIMSEEIVSRAAQGRVFFKIRPRPGYPQMGSCRFLDLVPMIAKDVDSEVLQFPLVDRFRIWTTVWGTSGLIKKLVEANPGLLEKAHTLGVSENLCMYVACTWGLRRDSPPTIEEKVDMILRILSRAVHYEAVVTNVFNDRHLMGWRMNGW